MKMKRTTLLSLLAIAMVVVSLGIFCAIKLLSKDGKKTQESAVQTSRTIETTQKVAAVSEKKSEKNSGKKTTSEQKTADQKETAPIDSKAADEKKTAPVDPKDIVTITFAVPDVNKVDEMKLKIFNQEMQKDGHPYQLQIEYVDYNTYVTDLEGILKAGKTDISFMGLGDGSNSIVSLLKSGAVVKLDEILTTEKGKTLYEAFPKSMWETVKCDGHIYSIPNATWSDAGIYAAFNKDHISDEAIENWDGTVDGIYEMIKDVKWDDASAPRFQYLISDYEFDMMIGCDIRNGLLYDYDTLQIENPLESEKFIRFFRKLEQMKKEGFLAENVSYYRNTAYADEEEALKEGNFLAVLSNDPLEKSELGGNCVIKELAPVLQTRINGSIGIANNPDKIDACIDFLSLLYGQKKYGNLLIYGRFGEEYKLEDGYAVNLDGTDKEIAPWRETWMNLFIELYPARGEQFANNRKESIFSFYDHAKISPFVGFVSDGDIETVLSDDMSAFLKALNGKTLDEAVKEYSAKMKSDGIEDHLNAVRSQWEAYQKATQS